MAILCRLSMHRPGPDKVFHRGSHWTRCTHCGASLIRQGTEWRSVSRRFRVEWRVRTSEDGFYHFSENNDRTRSRLGRFGTARVIRAASISPRAREDGGDDRRSIAVEAKSGEILPMKEAKSPSPVEPVLLRIDRDIVDWFKRQDPDWQARINATLRAAVTSQTRSASSTTTDKDAGQLRLHTCIGYSSYPGWSAAFETGTDPMRSDILMRQA